MRESLPSAEVDQPSFEDWLSSHACCQCGCDMRDVHTSADHVPSKGIFLDPMNPDLPTVQVCAECNRTASRDESYFYSLLSSVLVGSHEHSKQKLPKAGNVLRSDRQMRREIHACKIDREDGVPEWRPDEKKVTRFLIKNAKNQIYKNTKSVILKSPLEVWFKPFQIFSEQDSRHWNESFRSAIWSEIGTKGFRKQVERFDANDEAPWETIEDGCYQSMIKRNDHLTSVRMVFHNYLAAKIVWETPNCI